MSVKILNRALKKGYESRVVNGEPIKITEFDQSGRISEFEGTAAATSFDSEAGFTKGSDYIKTDAVTGVSSRYENIGTTSSSSFAAQGSTLPVGSISAGEIADGVNEAGTYIRKTATIVYEFGVDGGAISVITPVGNVTIPDGSIIVATQYIVNITAESATDAATIKFGVPTDGDLTTAIAISNGANPWDSGAYGMMSGTGAFATDPATLQLTAARQITMTVAVEALTAGDITLLVDYLVMA